MSEDRASSNHDNRYIQNQIASSLGAKLELSGNAKSQGESSENEKVSGEQQKDQGSASSKKNRVSDNAGREISHRFNLILHGNPYPVMEDEGPFSNFFLDKISKNIREKYPRAHYELEKNANLQVTAVIWYNINDNLRKELEDALEWTLRKTEENRKAGL